MFRFRLLSRGLHAFTQQKQYIPRVFHFNTRFYNKEYYDNYMKALEAQKKAKMEEGLKFDGEIPRDKLDISFSCSGGPGGQNVNKVATKVDIRMHIDSQDWIPDEVKERLKQLQKNRINKKGELVVQSSVHRTQEQNLEDAIGRLREYLEEAYAKPKERHLFLGRTPSGDKKRLHDKKKHSEKKQRRRGNWDFF